MTSGDGGFKTGDLLVDTFRDLGSCKRERLWDRHRASRTMGIMSKIESPKLPKEASERSCLAPILQRSVPITDERLGHKISSKSHENMMRTNLHWEEQCQGKCSLNVMT